MSVKVETYYSVLEKQKYLAELCRNLGKRAAFIVPSGLDKEPLLQLISPTGFFGARPTVWTWGELYQALAPEGERRRVIDPPDHNLIIRHVLELYLKRMEQDGTTLPDGVRRVGFANILGENIRDLLVEDVSPEYLHNSVFREDEEYDPAAPEAILSELYSDYVRYLAEYKIADNAQVPTLTAELLRGEAAEAARGRSFVFVGFLSFAGGQLRLVRALEELTECLFVLPYSGISDFHDAIEQVGENFPSLPERRVNIAELRANNPHLEFDALAREIALWPHGEGGFNALGVLEDYGDIGIMAGPERVAVLENALRRYKIPYNVQVRGSVGDTLLGALPRAAWASCAGGWRTKETAWLLANPLLGCANFNAADAVQLFPDGVKSWEGVLDARTCTVFARIREFCAALETGGVPAVILRAWRDFLSSLDITKTAAADAAEVIELDGAVRDLSSSLGELDKKIDILEDLSRGIGPAAQSEFCGAEAAAYISDWSSTATLPIPLPQSSSVTVYGGPPPTLTTHRCWIMTDVDYNTWPGRLRESPLLCGEKKRILNAAEAPEGMAAPHLPEIHEEREQKEALFRRLIATGRDCVIIARSLTDASGRPVSESQFMEPVRELYKTQHDNSEPPVIIYPLSRALPDGGDLWFPDAEVYAAAEKTDRGVLPRVGKCPPAEKPVISLSSLDEWAACPFRYWCRYKLRLPERRRELFDAAKAGSFTHRLWELAWGDYLEKPRSFGILTLERWDEAVNEQYPEFASDTRLRRHAERLRKQVSRLAGLQDEIESSLSPLKREKTAMEVRLPEYEIDGVAFKGRADRIDYYRDGVVLLDYKSNRADAHKKELQLAAYCVILESSSLEPYGYGWLGHGDAKLYGFFCDDDLCRAYHSPKSRTAIYENIELAKTTMRAMATAIVSGEYPAVYDSQSCRWCDFYTICRKREAPSWEREEENDEGGAELD